MLNLEDKRIWLGGGGLAAAVIAGAGWFFVVSPTMSDTDNLRSQTAAARQQTIQTQQKLNKLINERKDLPAFKAQLAGALAGLPVSTALPDLTRQLSAQAQRAGVRLQGVTIGAIGPATGGAGAAGATTTGSGTAGSTSTSTSTGTGAAAGGTGTSGTAPAGISGPVSIQVTVNSTGAGNRQLNFLHLIQSGPRRALVSSFSFSSGGATAGDPGATTMTLQLTVFATPKSAADQARLLKLLAAK